MVLDFTQCLIWELFGKGFLDFHSVSHRFQKNRNIALESYGLLLWFFLELDRHGKKAAWRFLKNSLFCYSIRFAMRLSGFRIKGKGRYRIKLELLEVEKWFKKRVCSSYFHRDLRESTRGSGGRGRQMTKARRGIISLAFCDSSGEMIPQRIRG